MSAPPSRRWATVRETAEHLGKSEATVRNYLARGYFPGYRSPEHPGVIFDLDEVDAARDRFPRRSAPGTYGKNAVVHTLEGGESR